MTGQEQGNPPTASNHALCVYLQAGHGHPAMQNALAHALGIQSVYFFFELRDRNLAYSPLQSTDQLFSSWQESVTTGFGSLLENEEFLAFCARHETLGPELCELEAQAFCDDRTKERHGEVFASWRDLHALARAVLVSQGRPEGRFTTHVFRVFTGVVLCHAEWQADVGFFELDAEKMLAVLPESPLFALAELL